MVGWVLRWLVSRTVGFAPPPCLERGSHFGEVIFNSDQLCFERSDRRLCVGIRWLLRRPKLGSYGTVSWSDRCACFCESGIHSQRQLPRWLYWPAHRDGVLQTSNPTDRSRSTVALCAVGCTALFLKGLDQRQKCGLIVDCRLWDNSPTAGAKFNQKRVIHYQVS